MRFPGRRLWRTRSADRRLFSPGDQSGTRLGTDDGFRAVIDTRGAIEVAGRNYVVDWWIGGDDKWYAPSSEVAVRQTRPSAAPVVVTRMRVHGADVVTTTWAAQADGSQGPAVVVEVSNETAVPVAVAVAVRAASGGQIRHMTVDGWRLIADGHAAVVVDRKPGRYALVDATKDLWDEVSGGRAMVQSPGPVQCRTGSAAGALVVPLPHRSTMRFAVPAGDLMDNPAVVLPSSDRVVAGWSSRLDRAATVELPDTATPQRMLVDLLLAEPEPAGVVELARWGLETEASIRLAALDLGAGSEPLRAAAAFWTLTRCREAFDGVGAVSLDDLVRSAGDDPAALESLVSLASLFDATGDQLAADDVRRQVSARGAAAIGFSYAPAPKGDPDTCPAAGLRRVAGLAVRPSADGLDLLPALVPDVWLGRPVEVHGLATPVGRLGFALRWHGNRPALLWQLERHDGVEGEVVLRVPGLDTAFSSTSVSGEVLLAVPATAST